MYMPLIVNIFLIVYIMMYIMINNVHFIPTFLHASTIRV